MVQPATIIQSMQGELHLQLCQLHCSEAKYVHAVSCCLQTKAKLSHDDGQEVSSLGLTSIVKRSALRSHYAPDTVTRACLLDQTLTSPCV